MIIESLGGGLYRLTALHGVRDIRTGVVHSEVICKGNQIKNFVSVQEQ